MNAPDIMKKYTPSVLRIGMSIIFIWFGSQQLLHTSSWLNFIPKSITGITGLSATTLVHFNGSFEIVFGAALLLGLFTRVTALFLALHMIDIAFVVGYSATGMRDTGLAIAAVTIFLYGVDTLCLDHYFAKKIQGRQTRVGN